jgi:hypothetical protein
MSDSARAKSSSSRKSEQTVLLVEVRQATGFAVDGELNVTVALKAEELTSEGIALMRKEDGFHYKPVAPLRARLRLEDCTGSGPQALRQISETESLKVLVRASYHEGFAEPPVLMAKAAPLKELVDPFYTFSSFPNVRISNGASLRTIFEKIDDDCSRTLDKEELLRALKSPDVSDLFEQLLGRVPGQNLFDSIDNDGSGSIDLSEFEGYFGPLAEQTGVLVLDDEEEAGGGIVDLLPGHKYKVMLDEDSTSGGENPREFDGEELQYRELEVQVHT